MIREFPNTGQDFSGFNAAITYLGLNGFSHGPMQRDEPVGVMRGDVKTIPKWRDIHPGAREMLDGTITFPGGVRTGTAIVEIFDK